MKRFIDLKDLGIAFSLANLWFISFWKRLVYPLNDQYFDFEPHSLFEYLAVFVDVLLLTFIFLILINLPNFFLRNWLKYSFQIIFLIIGSFAFGALSNEIIKWFSPKTINFVNLPLPLLVLSLCFVFAVKQKFRISAIVENLKSSALFLLPFSFLLFPQLLWAELVVNPEILQPKSIEKDYSGNRKSKLYPKVVWIIFDEADYVALTTAGRNNTNLPEFELLMNQSFTAQNALSPNDYTIRSIASLVTGEIVHSTTYIGANDLKLGLVDRSKPISLKESFNIFKEVRNLGGDTGIVGIHHPYSRVFQGQVAFAYWRGLTPPKCSSLANIIDCSINIFIDSLLTIPFLPRFFPSLWAADVAFNNDRDWQVETHNFLTEKATELISDSKLDLLYFHFGIPHSPFLARTNLNGNETYFNSLEVANDTLKQLRETLEKTRQWDDTVLIVSSDHWWRSKEAKDFNYLPEDEREKALSDIRIPFIVKFAGQKKRVDYSHPFNTVITKDFILALFKNEIKKPEEFIMWLNDLQRIRPDLINHRPEIVGPVKYRY